MLDDIIEVISSNAGHVQITLQQQPRLLFSNTNSDVPPRRSTCYLSRAKLVAVVRDLVVQVPLIQTMVEVLEEVEVELQEQVVQEVPLELNLILSPEASAEWTQL